MKVELQTYKHSGNGISLQFFPETDIEISLLHGLFDHGKLETGHPCDAKGNTGFYVTWKQPTEEKLKEV